MLNELFGPLRLGVFHHDAPVDRTVPLVMTPDGRNEKAVIRWGWDFGLVDSWAILTDDNQILDAAPLRRKHKLRRGDRVVFREGAIKSAAVGDVLGITCVFMPSGFAVGVTPQPGPTPSSAGGIFAYEGQQEMPWIFWVPKRRWPEMPRYLDEHGDWRKRVASLNPEMLSYRTAPEVGVKERIVRTIQQQIVAGVI